MFASIALVSTLALIAPDALAQHQERAKTKIVALVSRASDQEYLTEIPALQTAEEIEEFFDPEQFIQIWTEKDNLIALDRNLPALKDALNDQACLKLLSSLDDPTKPFLTSELSDVGRTAVLDQLRLMFPNVDAANDVAVRATMGVRFSFELIGQKGHMSTINLPEGDENKEQIRFMRENGPIPFAHRVESEEGGSQNDDALERGVTVIFRGVMGAYTATAIKRASAELERVVAESRNETAKLVDGLISKMCGDLLDGFVGSMPPGQVRLDSLPEEIRTNLLENFPAFWEMQGYDSREEMAIQLSTLDYVNVSPSFYLAALRQNESGAYDEINLGIYVGG